VKLIVEIYLFLLLCGASHNIAMFIFVPRFPVLFYKFILAEFFAILLRANFLPV